ncbi:MAG: efflux RND transporter periplasmic adaptor subunit [Cetobacterium sp.]|uniref:efflux RND transporter periplasmic adaptor subunit n=1 Tax=Cetobacterium sp. TaxID=2071632 RepID=UPI003F35C1EC
MKKKLVVALIILIIPFIFLFFKKNKVSAFTLEKRTLSQELLLSGTIEGENIATLSSEINGVILEVFKDQGDFAKADEVLCSLNSQEINLEIQRAKENLLSAELRLKKLESSDYPNASQELLRTKSNYKIALEEFSKFEKLHRKFYITSLEYNQKKNSLEEAKVQLELAENKFKTLQKDGVDKKSLESEIKNIELSIESLEKKLEKHFIKAPYDSYITEKFIEKGETLSNQTKVFQIASSETKIVSIDLDEKYSHMVALGASCKIFPNSTSSQYATGNIFFIGNSVNENTGSLKLKSTISENNLNFLYNSTVTCIIEAIPMKDILLVPEKYLFFENNKIFVFILENNRASLREIEGQNSSQGFIISKGAFSGDIILFPENLKDNEKVEIIFNQE